MSTSVVVTSQGFEHVIAVLDQMSNPQWDQLLRVIGMTVEEQVVNHFTQQGGTEGPWAPTKRGGTILVLTGTLRGSIDNIVGDMQVEVGSNLEYAKYHETGTRNMVRRAFLAPTNEDLDELQNVMEKFIESTTSG